MLNSSCCVRVEVATEVDSMGDSMVAVAMVAMVATGVETT